MDSQKKLETIYWRFMLENMVDIPGKNKGLQAFASSRFTEESKTWMQIVSTKAATQLSGILEKSV